MYDSVATRSCFRFWLQSTGVEPSAVSISIRELKRRELYVLRLASDPSSRKVHQVEALYIE